VQVGSAPAVGVGLIELRDYDPVNDDPLTHYLESLDWNKTPPAPHLPADVVARTQEKYLEAFRRLTGQEL